MLSQLWAGSGVLGGLEQKGWEPRLLASVLVLSGLFGLEGYSRRAGMPGFFTALGGQ